MDRPRSITTALLTALLTALIAVVAIAPSAVASPARTPFSASPAAPTEQVDQVPCEPHIGANATYHAHGAEFRTDAQGRPETAEATNLTRSEADRGPCQTKVGHMAPTAGYDGGHLIAATLHGVDQRYDLVPQWASVNRGLYQQMEAGAKKCLTAPGGKILRYSIQVTYPDATTVVPDRFLADVTVDTDGHPQQRLDLTFPNRRLDPAESQAIKTELNAGLRAAGCT
ncbi:DNA/RNA non-specific endonuclease [Actinomadura sp. KC06]|uniref:DNA/RNA non-specific endonuclease n=1 Tax=Actinomadura sp. KC06 TaxID=2530369 RepID=UPI001405209A|nr:DNA/RNA non-specific endonuclease [Actinomadura sp. KC06]